MSVPKSFPKFLDIIKEQEVGELDAFIKGNIQASIVLSNCMHQYGKLMPAMYILDYTQRKYVHASSNINLFVDHPLSRFLDGGLDFGWEIFNKDDLKIYGEKVLYDNLKFLSAVSPSDHSNHIFTCNYRVKNRKGEYRMISQQSTFIKSTTDGMPLATIGFLYDISPYTNQTKMVHTIESVAPNNRAKGKLILSNTYFPEERDSILSPREVEVLKWICQNTTSKDIAKKLNISIHTINNHRKHILEKTNSKTMIDLIRYAITAGYF